MAGAERAEWRSAVDRLAKAHATYSFRFAGPPPDGSFYTFALHDTDETTACRRYSMSDGAADGDFWYIEITVNDGLAGAHRIRTMQRTSAGPVPTANVTLLHRRDHAFLEAYAAVDGTVTVTSNPGPEEAVEGNALKGWVEAVFPTHPLFTEVCGGGGPTDGGPSSFECTCVDPEGKRSTCTPSGDESCCRDATSSGFKFEIAFSASHCRDMCRYVADAPMDYCHRYFDP